MKQSVGLIVTAMVGILFYAVDALPSGAPLGACQTMSPIHEQIPNPSLGYSLRATSLSFTPGGQVQVRVSGQFRGLFLQVRENINGESVGSWENPAGEEFQTINCFGRSSSAITHANRNDKSTLNFVWNSPSSCGAINYVIRATVVQTLLAVQENIILPLSCIPPTTSTTTTATLTTTTTQTLPPVTFTQTPPSTATLIVPTTLSTVASPNTCRFSSLTSVPVGAGNYATSFEISNGLNGWSNNGVRMWQRNKGSTSSYATGPVNSFDGSYYAYFEASSPAQPGDRAILQTSRNLIGCFCFEFAVSFYVSSRIPNHRLTVEVGGNEVFSAIASDSSLWSRNFIQIDTADFVEIRIIGERGFDWMGDMAIDRLRITPGPCPQQ